MRGCQKQKVKKWGNTPNPRGLARFFAVGVVRPAVLLILIPATLPSRSS
jgi:hypothetical protein